VADTLEHGHVRAEPGDQGAWIRRLDRVEQHRGVHVGRQQVRVVDGDHVDVVAESPAHRGDDDLRVVGHVDHADAAATGRRPDRVAVHGYSRRVAAAVAHLAQHPGEQFPQPRVQLRIA